MEKLVLDLKKLAEHFIRTNRQSFERENSRDEAAIQAINGAGMKHADREERVLQWLHSYRVLLFFPPENSRAIAGTPQETERTVR